MKPIPFKEQNTIFAEDQAEYGTITAYKAPTPQGEVISCWKLSFSERMRLLFTGKLWLCLLTFNKPLSPSFITTKKTDVLETSSSKPVNDKPKCDTK